MIETIKNELRTLKIEDDQELTVKYVTKKYKELAKDVHPDRPRGSNEEFQVLLDAFRRVIGYIEENDGENYKYEYETQFFMKNNVVKECYNSIVIYIEEKFAQIWCAVLDNNIKLFKKNDICTIFKSEKITVTVYIKPKKDKKSKIHVQSRDQKENMTFIMDRMSCFYKEVLSSSFLMIANEKNSQEGIKVKCNMCGKEFSSEKGLKSHTTRMHVKNKTKSNDIEYIMEFNDTYGEEDCNKRPVKRKRLEIGI